MTISEFFNANDPVHREAFYHLTTTGCWPKDFIPNDIEFSTSWPYDINSKMVIYLTYENMRLNALLSGNKL